MAGSEKKYNRERRKSPGLSNSSNSAIEKRGEIIHHRLAQQWYRESFTPDHLLSSQQLSVTLITVHHVSKSLTNPILVVLLPGLTANTAAYEGNGSYEPLRPF